MRRIYSSFTTGAKIGTLHRLKKVHVHKLNTNKQSTNNTNWQRAYHGHASRDFQGCGVLNPGSGRNKFSVQKIWLACCFFPDKNDEGGIVNTKGKTSHPRCQQALITHTVWQQVQESKKGQLRQI